ncbi:TPA: hypothetical protein ACPYU1_003376 [Raoultella planticola]
MKRGLRYVRIKGFSVSKLGLRIPAEKISAALPGMADGAFLGVSDSRRGAGAPLFLTAECVVLATIYSVN